MQHNTAYFIKFIYTFFLSLFSVILLLPTDGSIYQILLIHVDVSYCHINMIIFSEDVG